METLKEGTLKVEWVLVLQLGSVLGRLAGDAGPGDLARASLSTSDIFPRFYLAGVILYCKTAMGPQHHPSH